MNRYRQNRYEQGQILLIVVLIMVTVLTVGLSVVARSITASRITQEEASSERAFSAAEAGIEQALTKNLQVSGTLQNNASYQTSLSNLSGIELLLNNGVPTLKDDAVDIWLTDYPNYTTSWNGTMTIYWGQGSDVCSASEFDNTMAAVEIAVISGTKANPVSTRYPVDPCAPRASTNNFEYVTSTSGTVGGKAFAFKKTITVSSGMLVRVIPLYAPSIIGVKGCDANDSNCISLPNQGTIIQSVGTADTAQRKVISYRSNPRLPTELFPFVLFSQN